LPVTHQQIAEKLGISRSVVTLALHRSHGARIHPETRRGIVDAAHKLGYRPRTLTTHTIGYAVPVEELKLLGESSILIHVETALRRHGYRPVLVDLNVKTRHLQEQLNHKTVDGVLFLRWQEGRVLNLLSAEVPWILMSDEIGEMEGVDLVTADLRETVVSLVRYLAERGHQRICMITGLLEVNFHRRLWDATLACYAELGLPLPNASVIDEVDHLLEPALLFSLRSDSPPTAFITTSPEKTVTVLNLLCRNGYRVPEDISVASLFDLPLYESLRPLLTATTAMGANIALQAVTRLIEKITLPASPAQLTRLPGTIIERDSVRKIGPSQLQAKKENL